MSRSEQLRQLAVQLASLASLEDAVTHGLQSLLVTTSGLVAPISVAECALPASLSRPSLPSRASPLPKAAPYRPRGSVLLSQRGPTGPAVKSRPLAPPEGSGSSHHRFDSPPTAPGPKESAGATSPACASSLPMARSASAGPRAPAAPLRQGGAVATSDGRAHAGTRKGPMWCEIQLQALIS